MDIAEAVATLESHPDYRLLRRFRGQMVYSPASGLPLKRGIYLDTETDGVDTERAVILELAMVPFLYEGSGEIIAVREGLSFLNDPGRPLASLDYQPPGLTDKDLKGQSLDLDLIRLMLVDVDLVIAHNAGFDRRIVERSIPEFESLPWACSQQQVPWREVFNAPGERLEVLAHFMSGIFYNAHRALIDCLVGVHVLATTRDSNGRSAFSYLLENSKKELIRIWAVGAPYHTKDALSKRGYRWNGGQDGRPKAWHKVIPPEQLDDENEWLRETCGVFRAEVSVIEPRDRYSVRER